MLKCWNGTSLFFSTKIWYFGYFFATIKHIYFLIIVAEADSNLAQVIIFWIRCSQYLVRYLGKLKMEILKHVVVLLYILEKVLCKPGVPVFIILERHCNIVKWYYHMPRVSQLIVVGITASGSTSQSPQRLCWPVLLPCWYSYQTHPWDGTLLINKKSFNEMGGEK